jgi:acetate kinase
VDALVFTAGVGERGATIREKAVAGLEDLGIKIDSRANQISRTRNAETLISTSDSPVKIFVIPTDEELVMTEDTYALLQGTYKVHTRFTYSFQSPDYRNKERAVALADELKEKPELAAIIASPPS